MNTKKSTAISKIGDNPMQLVTLLDQKIAEMKKIEDTKWKTSGNISAYGLNVDLKVEAKIDNIIKVIASIKGQEQAYSNAQKALGIESAPAFTVSGHLVEDWVADAKLRIAINNQAEELETLRKFQDEAKEFITKEQKQQDLLERMAKYGSQKGWKA